MPPVIGEKIRSRRFTVGSSGGAELEYVIEDAADEAEAMTTLAATAPTTFQGLPRASLSISPQSESIYYGSARYNERGESRKVLPVGDREISFDTSGATERLFHSLATSKYPASAPDYQGAIGVTSDSVDGVEIDVPKFAWTETHAFAAADIDSAYFAAVAALTGKLNNAAFRGFAAGEVRFRGATGTSRSQDDWELTYRFEARLNETGLTVGSITGIAKGGWDYLWVRHQEEEDASAGALVRRPQGVYVETVYQQGDFSTLDIGTGTI